MEISMQAGEGDRKKETGSDILDEMVQRTEGLSG
jgi:hypothetical protein